MGYSLPVPNNTALKQLVYAYLLAVLDSYYHHQLQQSIINQKIPLYKGRDEEKVVYISTVALQLSKYYHQPAMEIAQAIASNLSLICADALLVRVVAPGSIHLQVRDHLLASWLQNVTITGSLENCKPENAPPAKILSQSRLFTIQYTHARCFSLILLAKSEGLIKFSQPLGENPHHPESPVPALGCLVSEKTIPWLSNDSIRLNHRAERQLISQLISLVDELIFPDERSGINWENLGINLCQSFEQFWSNCRIWGEVKTHTPELMQARLGLIMATQAVLRCLLVTKLGAFAPREL